MAFVLLGVGCLIFGFWARAVYSPEWMSPDTTQNPPAMRPWAVEADCYSQLARVQRILRGQGLLQNHFAVENWPDGLVPSTTAPFDYVILLLYAPLALFTNHPLDWAGALVSPALWGAIMLFWMLMRSRQFTLAGRAVLLLGSAALPAFIWATACGRPRHQSLILALMAMGLTAEFERWQIELTPKRAWNIFAGIVWGMAIWTSLFEPSLVLGVLVIYNLIVRRRENPAFLLSFGVVALLMLLLEGGHIYQNVHDIFHPSQEARRYELNWIATIAEVQPVSLESFIQQMTYLSFVLIVPIVAWRLLRVVDDHRADVLIILLTFVLAGLTLVQRRWVYYANLAELLLIARYFQAAPMKWTRWLMAAFFFFGIGYDNVIQIGDRIHAPANQPSLEMAQIARSIDGPGGIMAPWWLSPGLLYFSGQPIVSGSSHAGFPGILASARFFTATDWRYAESILREKKVRWVVVWDEPTYEYPVLNSARGILGLPYVSDDNKGDADSTMAQILITDQDLPTSLHLRGVTNQFKLYEYTP